MRTTTLFCAVALCSPASALAQGGMDAHGFVLAAQDGDARDGLILQRPGRFEQGQWFASGLFEYAKRPLVLIRGEEVTAALDDVFGLNVNGGAAVHDRVRLDLSMPVFFTSRGEEGSQGAAFGDIRLSSMIAVIRTKEDTEQGGAGFGIVPHIDLPTGATKKFLGQRGVAGGVNFTGTYELFEWTFTGNVGLQFNPRVEINNLQNADQIGWGFGAGYAFTEQTGVGFELRVLSALRKNESPGAGTPGEVLLWGRHRLESGAFLNGGLSFGITPGAGAAVVRAMLGGGFGRLKATPKDLDGDGFFGDDDACPEEPETVNGYEDEDGCPDELAQLAVTTSYEGDVVAGASLTVTGGTEVLEGVSAAEPWESEVIPNLTWQIDARLGDCLAGSKKALGNEGRNEIEVPLTLDANAAARVMVTDDEGTPIPGALLTWESESPECLPAESSVPASAGGTAEFKLGPGEHTIVVTADGYRLTEFPVSLTKGAEQNYLIELKKTKIKVEKEQIRILEKVQFEYNKDVIKSDSFELLNEVATVISRNPDVGRIEVAGHTDSDGPAKYNKDLSQRRAEAVLTYLVDKGVDASRLIAMGYGEEEPLVPNTTRKNKATNRRVEFTLVDQASQEVREEAP